MIARRDFLVVGSAMLLLRAPPIEAQTGSPLRSVGLSHVASVSVPLHAEFKRAMSDLGWVEGRNVEYRTARAPGDAQGVETAARELVDAKVDVIVTSSSQFARASQRATSTIPIVLAGVLNAVGAGLVASLAKPGGNITGVTSQQEEVLGKLIGILHELAPRARRIAILLNETNPSHAVFWTGAQAACSALDLVPLRVAANSPAQLGRAVDQITSQRAQAVVVVADAMFGGQHEKLHALLQPARLPVAYQLREQVFGGGLLSYGADLAANWRHAARYVDKILRGAAPADLPVEQAPKYDLVVNLKTAKELGLAVPQSLLLRADAVVQ